MSVLKKMICHEYLMLHKQCFRCGSVWMCMRGRAYGGKREQARMPTIYVAQQHTHTLRMHYPEYKVYADDVIQDVCTYETEM